MKKLNSKLFQSLEIKKPELGNIYGGNYTSPGSDTSSGGGSYDVAFLTTPKDSGCGKLDTSVTGAGTTDDAPRPVKSLTDN